MPTVAVLLLLLVLGATGPSFALDHKNLDEGRPLRLEDAYSIAHGEFAIETGAGFTVERRGPSRGFFPVELLYGAYPNLQLSVGTSFSTDPHGLEDRPRSGDLRFGALYNFNQETIALPAFAAKLGVDAPTGIDARGYAVELRGIITKSFERLSLHLNAGYEFLTSTRGSERDGRYHLALGASYPIGAPKFTRLTVVGDIFSEQSRRRGDAPVVGTELGLRYQLTPRIVWDVAVGTEFAGPTHRSDVFLTTGFSLGF
jgi:hypothetical protein